MRKLKLHPCGKFNEQYQEELTIFSTDFGRLWMWVGLFLLFIVIPFICKPYHLYVINHIGMAAIAAIGLNILTGYTGQISLGHGAFFGVGAYAAAILNRHGFSILAFRYLCRPDHRLCGRGFWDAICPPQTPLPNHCDSGRSVYSSIPLRFMAKPHQRARGYYVATCLFLGLDVKGDRAFYYVVFVCFVVLTWIAVNLIRTRFGRAFIAIRDNDRAAEGMGIPIFKYKLLSFAISSFYAGFAGGLAAYYIGSITPESYTLSLSVEYIAMIDHRRPWKVIPALCLVPFSSPS